MSTNRMGQLTRTRAEDLTAYIRFRALAQRSEGNPDWRRVRLRRLFGWTREDFAKFHLLAQQRELWTHSLIDNGDVAVLHVQDKLLEESRR